MIRRTLTGGFSVIALVLCILAIASYVSPRAFCVRKNDREWIILHAYDGLGRILRISSPTARIRVGLIPSSPNLYVSSDSSDTDWLLPDDNQAFVGLRFDGRGNWVQTLGVRTRSAGGSFGWNRGSSIFPIVNPAPSPPFPVVTSQWVRAPLWLPALMFAFPQAIVVVRALRRRRRRRAHECLACGYDLTGNVSGVCPECGRAIVRGCSTAE